ncbi:MAG: hypothetical protein AAGB25_08145 [Pseudomonadota bacterium]
MSGSDGFGLAAAALAILLSAIVRIIRTGDAWRAVEEGRAGVEHLRDLTGVLEPRALQDIFGPPTLEGIYPVAPEQVRRARRPLGRLMGDPYLDSASVAVAALSLIWSPDGPLRIFLTTAFLLAAGYQATGWAATSLLIGRR